MGKGMKHGAGGLPLNVAIVGGTAQPSSPRENTIWISTDTPICSWCIADRLPESVPDGGVVILTGKESPWQLNALKRTRAAIVLAPAAAMQKISGMLTNQEAFLYRNGSWVKFGTLTHYLYKNGQTPYLWNCRTPEEEITDAELIMTVRHYGYPTHGGYGDYGYMYTSEPLVIPQGYSKLSIRYYCTGTMNTSASPTHALVLRTTCNESNYCYADGVVASVSIPPTEEETVISLDVPDTLWGQTLYVGTYYNSNANSSNPKQYHIRELWLES